MMKKERKREREKKTHEENEIKIQIQIQKTNLCWRISSSGEREKGSGFGGCV